MHGSAGLYPGGGEAPPQKINLKMELFKGKEKAISSIAVSCLFLHQKSFNVNSSGHKERNFQQPHAC